MLCAAIAAVLFAKVVSAPSGVLWLAAVANGGAAAWIVLRTIRPHRQPGPIDVRVDGDGVLWWRAADTPEPEALMATGTAFVSSQVLMLSASGGSLAVWRDAVPDAVYRRIAVACRWPRREPPAGPASAKIGAL